MDQVKIGAFIAEARKEKGYTQRQLAEALDISDKTISKWETGKGFPEVSLILPLCSQLDISANELLCGERLAESNYKDKAEENMVNLMREMQKNKQKFILTGLFLLSLTPMFLSQFGGCRGVQEFSGISILISPLGVISFWLFLLGAWLPMEKNKGKVMGAFGVIGIVAAEIYRFFTWHILTISGETSFRISARLAFPEFYLGVGVSLVMVAVYFFMTRKKGR